MLNEVIIVTPISLRAGKLTIKPWVSATDLEMFNKFNNIELQPHAQTEMFVSVILCLLGLFYRLETFHFGVCDLHLPRLFFFYITCQITCIASFYLCNMTPSREIHKFCLTRHKANFVEKILLMESTTLNKGAFV